MDGRELGWEVSGYLLANVYITKELIFEPLKGWKEFLIESVPGVRTSRCKDFEIRLTLMCNQKQKFSRVAGVS